MAHLLRIALMVFLWLFAGNHCALAGIPDLSHCKETHADQTCHNACGDNGEPLENGGCANLERPVPTQTQKDLLPAPELVLVEIALLTVPKMQGLDPEPPPSEGREVWSRWWSGSWRRSMRVAPQPGAPA